ncbi:MAG: diguanylate cyclase [Lachnospiraceae bacterium]|nr:diguanylate cyclase [Lachnospiraceae bacterium]
MNLTGSKIRLLKIINGILVFLAALTILIIGVFLKDDWISPKTDNSIDLYSGWTRINPDGSYESVSGNFSIGKTLPVTFFRTLPENLNDDMILRIKCPYRSVDAYIGENHIYHAGTAKIGRIETTLGNVFALIPMKKSYSGKIIYITVAPRQYNYEVLIKDAAITTMSTYALNRMFEIIPYFLLCTIIGLISVISLILYVVFKVSSKTSERDLSKGFLHLSFFGICAIGWIISDYHIIGMLTGKMALSGVINYIAFMLCPFMFAGVLLYIFGKKLFFKIMFLLSESNFLIQMFLFMTGIMDLPKGLIVSQILTAMLLVGMLYFGFILFKNYHSKKNIILLIPTSCFILFSITASVTYVLNGKWMFFVALAMTFYSFTVIIFLLSNLWNALKSNMELEHIKKIAYFDDMTKLENRRSYDEYINTMNERIKEGKVDDNLRVIMLDVNGLKKSNDIFGHKAGDELIIGSADCIRKSFDNLGRCFRSGGDEFVIIGSINAETYRKKINEFETSLRTWAGNYIRELSISIGEACRSEFPECSLDELLEIADMRMYENKQHYYASQISSNDYKRVNRFKKGDNSRAHYLDSFALTKYTIPMIRQMAEIIPGGFFIYIEDEERKLLYNNSKILDIYGCKDLAEFKELTGYTFEGMVYHEDFVNIQNSIDKQIDAKDGDGTDHVKYRIVRKDGQIRWVDDYGHFSKSSDYGDIYYVFLSDITDQYENTHDHS